MHPFAYHSATTVPEAVRAAVRGARYIAGGTTLVDLMRETVERPDEVVDITALPLKEIRPAKDGALHIGALVTMAEAATHPAVRGRYPVVSQALEASASAQLRNMATIGGNLLQRTRCFYFRDVSAACNKRQPGSGCAALGGYNRMHAILGVSDSCVATHPSDVAVAFVALGAVVQLRGRDGERRLPLAELLLKPGSTPHREHALKEGELITGIEIPAHTRSLASGYLKVRDRQSYEFALTSAAVALHLTGGRITTARVAAGGVGTVPWRLEAVEEALVGQRPRPGLWSEAARHATRGARPLQHNRFKLPLLTRTVERQLTEIGGTL
ncbi:xanthine dehydrogenase family protein subunit M [Streptomyces sp. NPDC004539]|uniref:FAD binding domain-containing protein n=1 Tax=Streptomyces sp. NPDC004539 TaxID=3154280 RepID=UPI0033B5CD7A